MRKPGKDVFLRFCEEYKRTNEKLGLKQYLIPYLISSHPGSRLDDAIELALFLKEFGFIPDQVQDFYPTPGTLATCMFYTELDPYTLEPVFVPKTPHDKAMQRALLQYFLPQNRELVLEALKKAGRADLIGNGPNCLIAGPSGPRKPASHTAPARRPSAHPDHKARKPRR
jgi:radical SAM superfamily enzyme YgiQ (UPF0313 family)